MDLVLTEDVHLISEILLEAPLGKSDHALVKISLNCNKNEHLDNVTKRRYDKGDYDKLRKMLEIDWEAKLNCDDVQLQWKTFTNIYKKQ